MTHRSSITHLLAALATCAALASLAAVCAATFDGAQKALALAIIAAVASALALWKIPEWQIPAGRVAPNQPLPRKDWLAARTAARGTLAQILGGLAVLATLAFTWQELADGRRSADETLRVNREGQVTERFTRAVDQLGNNQTATRVGGVFTLEQIAQDSPEDARPVLEILTAFIRMRAPWPTPPTATPRSVDDATGFSTQDEDVRAALTVIGRGTWPATDPTFGTVACVDLARTDLRGIRLTGAGVDPPPLCLAGANLAGANLRGANLAAADLRAAILTDANLRDAILTEADLRDAVLIDADLRDAVLIDADLRRADLTGASLDRGDLTGAALEAAHLDDAKLTEAVLVRVTLDSATLVDADLRFADLTGASLPSANLSGAVLAGANLSNAYLWNVDLTDALLYGANLTGAVLTQSTLVATDIGGADLTGAAVTQPQIDQVLTDERTRLPANLHSTPAAAQPIAPAAAAAERPTAPA